MFNDFLEELKVALSQVNAPDIEGVCTDFQLRYQAMLDSGKSEFESVLALGDPQEIARKVAGQSYSAQEKLENNLLAPANPSTSKPSQKPPTKAGIYCTDIFYMTPITFVSAIALVAFAFLTLLVGFASVCYLVLAWINFHTLKEQILCFIMALCGTAMFAGGVFLFWRLVQTIVVSIQGYARERRQKLQSIEDAQ